ncbi:MAG: response regulator [Planctomycetes bacterium]|nr:response regulator [Planctomycetota bacterium]
MKRVLVIDYMPMVIEVLKEKLGAPNLSVTAVFSVEDAERVLLSEKIDAVVSAVEMQDRNGYDILNFIKEESMNIPVIFVSSAFLGNEQVKEDAIKRGAYAAIERPIFLNSLYEAVETALDIKIDGLERRRYPRLPIYLTLTLTMGQSNASKVVLKTSTVDISLGGLCFEYKFCPDCKSFRKGGMDPQCVFYKYYMKNSDSKALKIALSLIMPDEAEKEGPYTGDVILADCKVAHIIREEGKDMEYIGVKFMDFPDSERTRLKSFLKQLAEKIKEESKTKNE